MFFVNLMNINFNNRNNNRYLILFFTASVFGAIVFLASYEDIQSVFANSQVTMKDQMNNMMGMQNPNMMMDPNKMQTMMGQMNKTGMMMGPMMMDPSQMQTMMGQMNKTGMMMGPMMGKTNK
jgi:hypothetical protein